MKLYLTGQENDWTLSSSNPSLPSFTDDEILDAPACVVGCHIDELLILSLTMKLPIYIPKVWLF